MENASYLIPLLSVFGLILLSAFFSGSETGLTSVTSAKIHKLKMEGNRRAITVSKLREDKERLIGSILLGNNVVNIASSAIATALAIRMFGEEGVVYATAVMTVLVLVFAEVLPKTYAVRHAEQVALAVAPIFVLITKLLSPFTMGVQFVVNAFISMLSIKPQEEMTSSEVLRGAVEMYHEEGSVLKEDKDMLSGVFDLGETAVESIMIHRSDMTTINADDPVEDIIRFVSNSNLSRIPLWRDSIDNIIGIIHTKDLFKLTQNCSGELSTLDITSIMHTPWFVPETTTLKNQLKVFQEQKKHLAIVVDEFGGVTGLITLEDIIEEVVGEIDDEHDKPAQKRINRRKDGSYDLDGDLSLRDLNKEVGWNLEEEDVTTLAGYVMAHAQRIPEIDDILEVDDFMFQVLSKSGNRITRIKIRRMDDTESSESEEVKE